MLIWHKTTRLEYVERSGKSSSAFFDRCSAATQSFEQIKQASISVLFRSHTVKHITNIQNNKKMQSWAFALTFAFGLLALSQARFTEEQIESLALIRLNPCERAIWR